MKIVIDENSANQRFDRFLRKYFKVHTDVKLGDIFSWLRTGKIKIATDVTPEHFFAKKKKESYHLLLWDVVVFSDKLDEFLTGSTLKTWKKETAELKQRKLKKISDEKLKSMIAYEDKNRLAFDKPAGTVIHPSNKHWNDLTMHDYLLQMTSKDKSDSTDEINTSGETNNTFKASFCFRLDKDTSWVLIAGKTYESLQYLNKLIRERQVEKYYLTVIAWKFPEYKKIDVNLERWYNKKFDRAHVSVKKIEWKKSLTEAWNLEERNHPVLGPITLLKVKIYTWRMHQIRVHLAHIGFPVLWDLIYGNPVLNRKLYKNLKINRQLLHCWEYIFFDTFAHSKLVVKAEIPSDFLDLGFWKRSL